MQILRIDSSPQRPSVSHQLTGELIAELMRHDPSCRVVHRDLGRDPLSHLSHQTVVPIRTAEASETAWPPAALLETHLKYLLLPIITKPRNGNL